MGSLQSVGANLVRNDYAALHPAGKTGRLSARLALDEATRTDAYAVRHASYLAGGYIDKMPRGLFSDGDDLQPNCRSIVIYKDRRPVASVRLCTLIAGGQAAGNEIPAARVFPEAVAALIDSVPAGGQPARLTEINRLVRHPDFEKDYELVFVLFRFVAFMVDNDRAHMTLSCVRRNHAAFYKRLHFEHVAGPRRYAGVKFETNLMACKLARYDSVLQDIPFVNTANGGAGLYEGLFRGETVDVFAEG